MKSLKNLTVLKALIDDTLVLPVNEDKSDMSREHDAIWHEISEQLRAQKAQLVQEIRSYPPPIPACDAQFNYLLERRDLLSRELNRLDALRDQPGSVDDLLDFVGESLFLGEAAQGKIRTILPVSGWSQTIPYND